MARSEQDEATRSRTRSTRVRLGIALLVLLIAAGGLWLARKPIARGFVDRTFADAHVPARYTIQELAFGHQRLTDIVIGDPNDPDLIADWIELETSVGVNGARVVGVRAGHVRARGRIVDGALSLGSLDRLIPKGAGGAFRLPAIALDLNDGRMRLETPQGLVGIKATGNGRLDGGFRGSIAAVSERVASGACIAAQALAVVAIDIRQDAIRLSGPLRAARAGCAGNDVAGLRADLDARLTPGFDAWHGSAKLAATTVKASSLALGGVAGTVGFAGSATGVQGKATLNAAQLSGAGIDGRAATIDGAYRYTAGKGAFAGQARVERTALSSTRRAGFAGIGAMGAGTPVGPLAAQLAKALDAAAQEFAITADLAAATDGGRGSVTLSRLIAVAESGASVSLTSKDGTQFVWPNGGATLRGDLVMGGGGLPELSAKLSQPSVGAPISGIATIEPYSAGGARLALAPVKFSAGLVGRTRIDSVATLSGPLAGGAVEGLRLPIAASYDGRGGLLVNPTCAALSATRVRLGGLDARQVATQLCPIDGAMVRVASGRIGGGATAHDLRLAGALGSSPLTLGAGQLALRLGERSFRLDRVALRLGTPDRLTRLDVAQIAGTFDAAPAGSFSGAGGQIGAVPLLLSDAAGTWRYSNATLALDGALRVSDTAADPRFKPLAARGVALTLADNRIVATGMLATPDRDVHVADVVIAHDLSSGTGRADLVVAGLHFTPTFQPDALTPLTEGVVANVVGLITGEGHIAWSPTAVTSTGVFRTANTSLAAAFGPVTGIATELRFTDLLGMVTAPDQRATIKSVDTGIAVNDGVVRYQLLGPNTIRVADARWPFAGGQLNLEPTTLDFLDPGGRRLTFTLTGVDAAQFLQQFDFKNLNATGVFDGTLPMIFDINGGRIENGRLVVRQGGGTIAYVGQVSREDVGVWGNLAFQALKSLKYRSLDLTMNGPLAGEVITEAHFSGVAQGEGAKTNFLIRRLQKLPFVFNVKIRAPFRSLIDSAQSLYDPSRLIKRNLPELLRQQNTGQRPVQPPASETKP